MKLFADHSPHRRVRFWLCALASAVLVLGACGSDATTASDDATPSASDQSTTANEPADTDAPADTSEPTEAAEQDPADGQEPASVDISNWIDAWLVNVDGEVSAHISDIPVNVQSVEIVEVDGVEFMQVTATGIPNYEYELQDHDFELLESRPFVDTDFGDGGILVEAGDIVAFGEDIGYVSACDGQENAGAGYWPPGPACATQQSFTVSFPANPQLAAEGEHVTTGAGQIGLWVNGVSIFNWGDTTSYNNEGVWQNLAPVAEARDLDICPGHSAMGEYHHHSNPACLGSQLGDDGTSHSPIYGFAIDGFPLYGPWAADGQLVRSSWVIRDLDDADSVSGCGEAGARTCIMVDQLDPSLGTESTEFPGPTTADEETSLSGNIFPTTSGFYMEDYYYDDSLNDGTILGLDQYNGHDHDGLGYHYHVTSTMGDSGQLLDAFPYYIGLELAGVAESAGAGGAGPDAGGDGPGADGPDLGAAAEALGITEDELTAALGVGG